MGSLEGAVLDVLWTSAKPLKPGEVLDRLAIEPSVSYSTVLTILRRLWKKDMLTRERDGKAYRYATKRSREEQVAATMADAFATAADPAAALGHFIDQLSDDDSSVLRRILRRQT